MLILTRKPEESIIIKTDTGALIEVKVISVFGKIVRLGVHAPKTIEVDRKEIKEKKDARNLKPQN